MAVRGVWCAAALIAACSAPRIPTGDPAREIAAALERSANDWNRGDLDGFMSDYANDSLTSYVSAGHVQYGWQALYDHYQTAYFAPGKSRDSLSFAEIRVRPLTMDLALATARFRLSRGDSLVASGPFTLLLQRRSDRWLILHDHTSADPAP
ncbi:MAG: YybH family protein [Gemmatimonadales bacterium]